MADFKVIGKDENKDKQAVQVVTGKLDFSADLHPGNKLYCRLKDSPYAAAKITSIDTSAAEALEGVAGILTYKNAGKLAPLGLSEEILCAGQEVAVVAATEPSIAEKAVQLINVEYDPLPFVTDPDEAMEPGAPLVYKEGESNVSTSELLRGDFEAGFAEADVVFETSVGWTNYFQHNTMETHSAIAWWEGDHLYSQCSSQNVFAAQAAVAGLMEIPLHKHHCISHGTGCGYGDKHFFGTLIMCPEHYYAALLSQMAGGKPVECVYSRYDNFTKSSNQFAIKADFKFGAKSDGTLTAIDCTFYADDANLGASFSGGASFPIRSTYKCPNGRFKAVGIKTNKPRTGAWRCVADPPGNWLTQVAIDQLAYELGMDPLEFRLKNHVTSDMPHQDSGLIYASNGIYECTVQPTDAIGWAQKWHAPGTRTLPDGRMHGIGMSASIDSHGQMSSPCGAIINFTADGKAQIATGITRAGCGTNTAHAHIVAEKLGLPYDDVSVGAQGVTDVCSDGGGQGGSTRTITVGAAFYAAAEDALQQLFARAEAQEGIPPFRAEGGKIIDSTGTEWTFADLVGAGGQLVARGYTWPKQLQREHLGFPIGTPCEVRGVCGAVCEVAVDTETGEVEILNFINCDDVGMSMFKQGTLNQLYGGLEIEIGQGMFFEHIVDKNTGITLNASQLTHRWPTPLDHDGNVEDVIIVETDDACGPFGCKGIGEPVLNSFGCIANAVYNATGVWVKEAPLTPQRLLKALGKA
ncbi:MAG: xanthine dehydrogenase family protein molybdopterin-binding subunit [Dehalococcoidia bacterium]|nr:MAG: xanthine dehydrogenase family protein molybdopterin-binding subunit [Dehalococcoidia bacterium]